MPYIALQTLVCSLTCHNTKQLIKSVHLSSITLSPLPRYDLRDISDTVHISAMFVLRVGHGYT